MKYLRKKKHFMKYLRKKKLKRSREQTSGDS